jgi:tetratricopeptide (TPR) repeat protein
VVPAEQRPEPIGAYKTLETADQAYERGELEAARTGYLNAIQESEEKPLEAKAYYGLAKLAIRRNEPDLALELLEKSLASSPDDYVKGWVLVYLARLSEAQGLREKAREYYQAASEVPNASLAARQAAAKGLQQEFKK